MLILADAEICKYSQVGVTVKDFAKLFTKSGSIGERNETCFTRRSGRGKRNSGG